jgi:prepilin-type N-terminal cleavage/methylation domain-containing protein
MKNGFTLIELLVVVALVAIIGSVTTQVFILGFKAQAKVEAMKELKQSGDYTISVIESMVRNASDIEFQCNTSANSLTIISQDGLTTNFLWEGSRISSISGQSQPLTSSKVSVGSCSFRVVCPTPPLSPKYVFVNFTLNQAMPGITPGPGNNATLDYQTTISLRTYQ